MLETILDFHFDPDSGTPYWLDVLQKTGFCRHDFRTVSDLHLLGPMDVEALRSRPITDFIPASLLPHMKDMILAETGGTTGDPCRRVYLPEEFHAAFVAPWLEAVNTFHFPTNQSWLFIGPSGPHIIAQAARAFARATESLEPFSIDCDTRWIKQQQPDSMGHMLYMDHLLNQAMNIINQQEITVLFTTPPLLLALAERMSTEQRQRILGIHTGGMAQDTETGKKLALFFPSAVILPGYGNSLFGVAFEKEQAANKPSVFFVHDSALHLQLIPLPDNENDTPDLTKTVTEGERGRVMFHRFDKSFLLINMLERDTAIRVMKDGRQGLTEIGDLSFQQKNNGGVY
ncbi:MAG TPA: hypothetical protein EYG88_04650 [Desulfocapsa sulfexigens]|nr:hypothetical protein [Desulfocapsa sulfexigens]